MGGYAGVEAGVRPLGGSSLVIEALRGRHHYYSEGLSLDHSPCPIAPGPAGSGCIGRVGWLCYARCGADFSSRVVVFPLPPREAGECPSLSGLFRAHSGARGWLLRGAEPQS